MLKNKTELQDKIFKAISGHKISEVIHAFELIKIELFLDDDLHFEEKHGAKTMDKEIEEQIKQTKKFNEIYNEGVSEAQEEKTMKDVAWSRGYKQGQQDKAKEIHKEARRLSSREIPDCCDNWIDLMRYLEKEVKQ